jgi:UDP-N-acetylglucosamine--N-acetylmuramyl-(pentapeptide) pyrophosphoryl-undecaprenol N-acetylglucosamine transferase
VVFLPDVRPGWAVRAMARLARRVAVTSPRSLPFLPPGKAVVTGYPVRPAFWQATKMEARRRLSLQDEERVLFIAGATHGARTLNQIVAKHLSQVLELCQLIHISGRGDHPWLEGLHQALPERLRHRYHLHPYLYEDLPWAMAAADLAVMRSGASVMGELPALGLPAVLVPYPYAGGHQRFNAHYLADAGAALVMENDKLNGFLPLVGELLADEQRRAAMAEASRRLARPNAARDIARILLEAAR